MDNMDGILNNFEKACKNNDVNSVRKYLERYNFLINYDDGYYFDIVADSGNIEMLELFIEYGENISLDDNYALYICAEKKYDDCVLYLLKNGANLETIKYTTNFNHYKQLAKLLV